MGIGKKLKKWNKKLAKKLKDFRSCFRAKHYIPDLGKDDRFGSWGAALFRKMLKNPVYTVLAIWLASLVYRIAVPMPLPDILLGSVLWTVGNLLGLTLWLCLQMLLEAVTKVMSALILDGELPGGADNPFDGFVAYLTRGWL